MENFIVSARKYRPATFDTVIGQKGLTTTLKNAIQENKLAHAYLFCGPRGVGKTTCARIFAKTINCEHLTADGESCNECESCRAFNEGRSYSIHELDAASNNSVEDIRNLIEQVRIPPQVGNYKVFIIDEVHMLSTAAFNAFLKTLEEPPAYAKFILATTERHKVLPTILSRCQVYDFYRIGINDIVEHLRNVAAKEGVEAEEKALMIIAQKADGGMRDALSLFDQMVSYTQGHLTYKSVIDNLNVLDYDYFFRFTDLFLESRTPDCMLLFNEILQRGFDGGNFIGGLASHFRDLLVSRDAVTLPLLDVSNEMRSRYQEQAQKCSQKFLYKAIRLCNDCDMSYRTSRNKRLLVELTLIRLSQATSDDDDAGVGRRPAQLKPIFGAVPAAPAAQQNNSTPSSPSSQPVVAATQHVQSTAPATPNLTTSTTACLATPTKQPASTASSSSSSSSTTSNVPATAEEPSRRPPIMRRAQMGVVNIRRNASTAEQPAVSPAVEQAMSQPEAQPSAPIENLAVDEPTLQRAWRSFTASLPHEEIAMAERMNAMLPHLEPDGASFYIEVSNQLVEEDMRKMRPRVEQYLHTMLHNQQLNMRTRMVEASVSVRFLSPREQFEKMKQENDTLQALMKTFDLDLV